MTDILILKTGALGDVLRTTSILPGLHARYPGARVTWVTASGAVDLVAHHPLVERVVSVAPSDEASVAAAVRELGATRWARVVSLDDEVPLCRAAAELGRTGEPGCLSGAWLDGDERRYTPDTAPWFDMGLLSVHGKEEADRRKAANTRSHPEILASMLGIEPGHPELPLPEDAEAFAARFAEETGLAACARAGVPAVGLNTGAGGRWESKKLPVERVVEIARRIRAGRPGACFVVLGGPDEAARNRALLDGLRGLEGGVTGAGTPGVVDGGTENALLEFAAIVGQLDLLLTSDSLGLHVGVARRVPVVAFFAPTSAAEIELYGRGEKVASTAPDYCSYRKDADTSTLTPERIADACLRWIPAAPRRGVRSGDASA